MTDASGAAVLVVDDRPANLRAMEAALEPLGLRVLTAASGEQALKLLLRERVSVILLDVQMPVMDGMETARRIKSRDRTSHIPIIFLSAVSTTPTEILEGFTSGAVDYVTKPVDPALIQAKVKVFVDLATKTDLLRRQTTRLTEQLEQRYEQEVERLRKLADAALAINSTLALEDVLRVINDSARAVTGANEAETVITARPSMPLPERSRSFTAKYAAWASEGAERDLGPIYDLVLEGPTVVRMTRDQIDRTLRDVGARYVAAGHPMLEGWLAAPLISRDDEVLGLIQVADKAEGDFSAADEVVLVQLAQLAVAAIANAERFAQEHLIAETLQRAMLPSTLVAVDGLRLAARYVAGGGGTQVGGDWYDTIVMDDGRVMLAVGDVVGRGPRAAAVMGQLRTAMRAYALQQLPATVLMRSLDLLLQDVADGALATAVCAVLDPRTGALEVVLAGHPPPLVVDPGGSAGYLRGEPHTPMGVREAPLFLSSAHLLAPGSTIVLFSDGLVESRSRPVADGLAELSAHLDGVAHRCSPDELATLCLERMVAEGDDDVALLAVRYDGPVP
ncbi:MAG TPA: SpoIIE family protein phosphatase [Acidimicrobiales bacterium]|nr:SpoIIE family protein phosphatase [Acidimicrobiales bacterium]